MNAEAIRQFLDVNPFEPFHIQLSSGQEYRIGHPEAVMLLKNTLVVGDLEMDSVIWSSLMHVTAIRRRQDTIAG